MKKGLSALLILAALFGFYGGATNVNDILACKDYWEEKGEQTTADLKKLEDGINQLKDNEQAYLDGQVTLAEGEQTLADGEAQYAKGLQDYAEAPGKLADARKKLAAGEQQLADGQDSIDGLTQLIAGIKKIRNGYNKTWRPGYEKLKDGRSKLYKGANGSKSDLQALAAFLDEGDRAGYLAALEDVASDDEKQTAKDYKTFIKSTNRLAKDLPKIQKSVQDKYQGSQKLKAALSAADLYVGFAGTVDNQKTALLAFSALIEDQSLKAQYEGAINQVVAGYSTIQANIQAAMQGGMTEEQAIAAVNANLPEANKTALTQAKAGIVGALTQIEAGLKEVNEKVNGEESKLKNDLLPGLKEFNAAATEDKIDELSEGQNTISSGIATVASAVLGNKTLKAGVKKNFGSSAIKLLKKYKSAKGPLHTSKANFAVFEKQMDKNPGLEAFLKKAQKLLAKTKADGQKTLAAGKKTLADGYKQYAQGLKDYEAAPGKLADAERQLADGRKQLADGRAKLGEYEDGEQQVRDGLATVMGSEANGGLESILDRRNGDDDFDNGDTHLELGEGLEAVDTARGYQAESGALITDEIMTRAIGTGLSLGAAVLACLAALLGLLKKYKGAGVSAILAAIVGCVGIYQGVSAGNEFSSIAGSTVGNLPWVAAGILAAVAALHAITHFAAKKDA